MTNYSSKIIEGMFAFARVGIPNAKSDPFIAQVLLDRGYDEIRLDEGYALYEAALELYLGKREMYRKLYVRRTQLPFLLFTFNFLLFSYVQKKG